MDDNNRNGFLRYANGLICFAVMMAFIFSSTAIAAKKRKFPPGCTPTGFSFKYHVLMLHPHAAGKQQSLFFVHNKTLKSVRLFQMRSGDEPYIMHLNNTIKPNQWGVFSTDEELVKFICALPEKKSKFGTVINCKSALELCEYVNVKFSASTHGNYWSVGSNSRRGAINNVIHQGILLKW